MPDQALLPSQSHLLPIVLVYHLVQNHHPPQLGLILLSVIPLPELPDLPWGFDYGVVAGVSLALAGVGGMEVALVFVDYVTEEVFVGTAHIYACAEWLHLYSLLIELCLLNAVTEVD